MKKTIGPLLLAFVLYHSVYFEKLSEHSKAQMSGPNFSAKVDSITQFGILQNPLLTKDSDLLPLINSQFEITKTKLGNRLGIGQSAYFLVKGESKVIRIQNGMIELSNGSLLDTKYIFGNEIRDASRWVSLNNFKSQKDLNQLTETLNSKLREDIIPKEISDLQVGQTIQYIGACEVNPKELPIQSFTIYPVEIKH